MSWLWYVAVDFQLYWLSLVMILLIHRLVLYKFPLPMSLMLMCVSLIMAVVCDSYLHDNTNALDCHFYIQLKKPLMLHILYLL